MSTKENCNFRHPIYQEIEYRDLKNRTLYPKEIKTVTDENMSFTTSLDLNHEGGDFCLENKIKKHKLIAPKGRVSDEMWLRISRGLDTIEEISDHTSQMLKFEENILYRNVDIYDEVVKWRAILRSSNILSARKEEGVIKNIYAGAILGCFRRRLPTLGVEFGRKPKLTEKFLR